MNLDFQAIANQFAATYDLTLHDAEALAELLGHCPIVALQRGDVLFEERAFGAEMFLILEGRIAATRLDARGQPVRIAVLMAPNIAGHMSLIDGEHRSVTCTARRPTVVAAIDRPMFEALTESGGPRGAVFRHLLLATMSEQLASANDRIRTLIDPRTASRLDDETTEFGIVKATDALAGWEDKPPSE